ncbi:MAG: hypothetical protein ABFS46_05100 [Myxococcota bacterium]
MACPRRTAWGEGALVERRTAAISPLRARVFAAALFGLAVAAQTATYHRSLIPLDEGQAVAIGQRLVSGERMDSDIHAGIAPGVYYTTALLFTVFGVDALVARPSARWRAWPWRRARCRWDRLRRLQSRDDLGSGF